MTKEITPKYVEPETKDIDGLLHRGLMSISRMMNVIGQQAKDGTFDRTTVQNLKDLMGMLSDLKKREEDLLSNLSDEELEKLSKE